MPPAKPDCPRCQGTGTMPDSSTCPDCRGTGKMTSGQAK